LLYGFLFTKQNNKLKRKILPVFLLSSNMNLLKLSFAVLLAVVVTSCDTRNTETTDRVVIGIAADVQTFNPLFSVSVDEGSITELLYLSLVDFRWDEDKSDLQSNPMLAKKWEWSPIFSFDVYSDPEVQSGWYGTFGTVYTDEENHINIEKTFDVASQFEFTINFKSGTVPKLYDLVFPIISKHVYENIKRNELATSEINFNPVTNGPFKLKKWNRNQIVSLEANPESFLYNEDNIDELVFKVVQDYTSRILQLKHGDIDLMELVKIEDIEEIESEKTLQIVSVVGREYDYAGWNNIDPTAFTEEGKIFPNKFFSSSKVRIALSHAINRQEILEEYFIGLIRITMVQLKREMKSLALQCTFLLVIL
jgi:peptide/nickel transport system substrate-binding protein